VKRLFSYNDIHGQPTESKHQALTPYLFDAGNVVNRHLVVEEARRPLCDAPQLLTGCQPIDHGQYIFDAAERAEFLAKEPKARKYLHPYVGSEEFINGGERWILILDGKPLGELRSMPAVVRRMGAVRKFRSESRRHSTLQLAETPARFQVTVIRRSPSSLSRRSAPRSATMCLSAGSDLLQSRATWYASCSMRTCGTSVC